MFNFWFGNWAYWMGLSITIYTNGNFHINTYHQCTLLFTNPQQKNTTMNNLITIIKKQTGLVGSDVLLGWFGFLFLLLLACIYDCWRTHRRTWGSGHGPRKKR